MFISIKAFEFLLGFCFDYIIRCKFSILIFCFQLSYNPIIMIIIK